MAKITTTITNTTATQIAIARKPRNADKYIATIAASGTFGGGTFKVQMSPDGGTTKIDLKDQSGSAWSATANDVINIELGDCGTLSDGIILYGVNTGGTGINMTVNVFDNV
jgi:hypothetical protein